MRVAFSVLVILTESASASAFFASARTLRSSLRMLSRLMSVATRPVPKTKLSIVLKSILSIVLQSMFRYYFIPISFSHAGTLKHGHSLAASWLCPTILTEGKRLWKFSTYSFMALR